MGVQIEDNIPLTEEEMETMFVDLLPDDVPENDGTARVTCFLDDTFDVQEIKDKVTAEIKRLSGVSFGWNRQYNRERDEG